MTVEKHLETYIGPRQIFIDGFNFGVENPSVTALDWNETFKMGDSEGIGAEALGYHFVIMENPKKCLLTVYSAPGTEEVDIKCTDTDNAMMMAQLYLEQRIRDILNKSI